ncbi:MULTISPECIES: hypothetical protein [Catenuloplanes]|uniref:DUF8175 domain-containing protein n=1 Tax=Catenuloplanes niger TaxID=587534 RepID=A0AAE4CTN2_9ACTN|nr:hypothetical protein [Catenuloplanes niger]MDR7320864.1 hypothetical protein [Catenuloplanes niger]
MRDEIGTRARQRTAVVTASGTAIVATALAAVAGLIGLHEQRDAAGPGPVASGMVVSIPGTTGPAAIPSATGMPSPGEGDLAWMSVAGGRLPVSRSAGPRDTSAGLARGFAFSELGAVVAAAHVTLRLSPQVGPLVFEPTVRDQVVGDDAGALARNLAEEYDQARARLGVAYGTPAGQLYAVARGYRVSISGLDAEVRLLIEGPGTWQPTLIELRVQTRWDDGDWRVVAPPDGLWGNNARVAGDTSEFLWLPAER